MGNDRPGYASGLPCPAYQIEYLSQLHFGIRVPDLGRIGPGFGGVQLHAESLAVEAEATRVVQHLVPGDTGVHQGAIQAHDSDLLKGRFQLTETAMDQAEPTGERR